jgi:hypothetical protein
MIKKCALAHRGFFSGLLPLIDDFRYLWQGLAREQLFA